MHADALPGSPTTSQDPVNGLSAVIRVWRTLVDFQREMEATPLGRLIFGNAWPAYIFALVLAARAWGLAQQLSSTGLPAQVDQRADLVQQVVTLIFLVQVVGLFIIRRPVIGRRATWQAGVAALAGTFLLYLVSFVPIDSSPDAARALASAAITIAGTLFTAWALAALGRCFGMMAEARGLVTRGPYRWVRHPVYLGELLSALGIVAAKPHPVILALYLVFVGLQYWRAVLEESALADSFPDAYRVYRGRVRARLLPRWR